MQAATDAHLSPNGAARALVDLDSRIEEFLRGGAGAELNEITVRSLFGLCGVSRELRASIRDELGARPQDSAARTLYRLGWQRSEPGKDLLGERWYRPASNRLRSRSFALAACKRLRLYLRSAPTKNLASLSPDHLLGPLQLVGLDSDDVRTVIEAEMLRLGWRRVNYVFPALGSSRISWHRAKPTAPSMPRGSECSAGAVATPTRESQARLSDARKGIPPIRSARGVAM